MFLVYSIKSKQQKKSYNIYNKKFQHRITQHNFKKKTNLIKWNNVALIIIYRRKLKKNVKNEFMRIEKSTKNFKKLIEVLIRFDDILYNKVIKKKYNNSHKKFEIYTKKNFNKKSFYFKNKKHLLKIIFMKLNTITRRKKINFKKKRNNNKTCYLYNKSNHFARNYRNKII